MFKPKADVVVGVRKTSVAFTEPGDTGDETPGSVLAQPVSAALPTDRITNADRERGDDGKQGLPFSKARCIALVATVTGASFLNTMSVQSMIIILPTMGADLNIPDDRIQWVMSAYALAFGCFLLPWGRIADIYGKRLIFVLGSAFMTVTMIINPFVPNEIAFNILRGLQGLGAAANVPTAIGILGVTFPPGKAKNYAFSSWAAGAPLGGIFGNIMSGFIASYASWKWVFGAISGLCLAVTAAGLLFIPPDEAAAARRKELSLLRSVDWIGALLITLGLLALMFALTEGNVVGWNTIWIYTLMVIAFLLISLFTAWQWYQEKHTSRAPLMRVSIFKNRLFSLALFIMAVFFASFNDLIVYATFLFQDYQNIGALQTTLRYVPTGAAGIVTAIVVSRLISKVPTYLILMFGCLFVSVACLLFAAPINLDSTPFFAYGLPAMLLGAFGADSAWPSLMLFTSKSLPAEDQALGAALINACGQIGRAVGLAVTTAIQVAVMAGERGVPVQEVGPVLPGEPASLHGLRAANWFNFALALVLAVLVGLTFRGTGIVGEVEKKKDLGRDDGGGKGSSGEKASR